MPHDTKTGPVIESIMDKYHATFEQSLADHGKVMQVRLDLRYPENGYATPDSKHIHDFSYNLKRSIARQKFAGNHDPDPKLLWVREQNESEHPHYHALVLVNGNSLNNPHSIFEKAGRLWGRALGVDPTGLVHHCDKDRHGNRQENGIMIRRGSPDEAAQRAKCEQQASYLAKAYSKDTRPKGAWTCGGTRTPKGGAKLTLPRQVYQG
ncbi:inovirus-type Gp2 protein [Nitratidesulfovibrio sp. SRB-5]|uniref:YagK/YfjJ domain-containing protein n=1 Tax=Nitratidesulfovibrio sp. SRB-5 TaxID=2872636 RepID=UPI00167ED951|nr:inovirus-type Gp2 protein [Nitratidesulfovibrio sp. SRB-5]MBZ2173424.1 inovirus Gp2 family protein [Nitratidesulfovibrio sp. SRB-5]